MKGRITTTLSLAGVLVAGSAAAMVNTQVLQNTESKSSGEVAVASTNPANTPTAEPVVVAPGTGEAINGNVLTNTEVTKIQSNILTATQAMYQVGDAGLVTLDTSGNVLTVVSVAPSAGWTLVKAESSGPVDIEVKLQNGTTIVEFRAHLQAGVITTSVESKIEGGSDDGNSGTTPGSGSTAGGGTTPGSGSIDDDDDSSHESGHDDESDDDSDDSGHSDDD
ncbi:MAG: hypothetical protein K8R99_06430 [Actinomycetia bacterium]|nr:hypothetical protein [Actinomycetes bacterium]